MVDATQLMGLGWGGVGLITFSCTSTHGGCYATDGFGVGWGGDDNVFLHLNTRWMLRN